MNKIISIIFILFIFSSKVFALTTDDLLEPKPFAGKISNSDRVESVVENTSKINTNDIEKTVRMLPQKTPEKINKIPEKVKNEKTSLKSDENFNKKSEKKPEKKVEKKSEKKNEKITEQKTVQKTEQKKEQKTEQKTEQRAGQKSEERLEQKSEERLEQKSINTINANYADLSLKRLADDISYELEMDSAKTNSDLNILWAAATERSETMKYTIYKLSNPDEDKPDESTIKKILRPIANASSVVGASVASDPYLAAGALVGGGLVNAFMKDDKELNYKFSKVSDADMVLLVRKIGDLQKKLLDLYTDYKTKEHLAKMAEENLEKREVAYKNSQNKSREELVIADVYYRTAKTNFCRAQDEYTIARAILENLVGTDALAKIEE